MKEPCPACDHDLWHPGHVCYTYAEWRANIAIAADYDEEWKP